MATGSLRRTIEGRHHPLVKAVRRMVRSGELLADGQVLLETVRLVEDALGSGARVSQALVSSSASLRLRSLLDRLSAETMVYEVAPKVFETLVSTESSQGILAFVSAPQWQEEDLFPRRRPALILLVAGLQDPGNLGTILRTAEAFGATGAIVTPGTVSPYNAKAVRASAGALFRVPMLRGLPAAEALALLRQNQVRLFAAVVAGGERLTDIDFTGPTAVAIGSEGAGVPEEWKVASEPLTIPMAPAVESLNAAVAAAVILYEIARQRNSGGKR